MSEKPHLIINKPIDGEPLSYRCSVCGERFIFPEDQNPKEGAHQIWSALKEHVREIHPDRLIYQAPAAS